MVATIECVPTMSAYLLTWSPNKWQWKDLSQRITEIKKKGFCITDWSCGNNKSIAKGDRLFLLRQGEEPRGIVGAGFADSEPFEAVHWREEKAKAGRTTMYLTVRWETLLNPDKESIFPREWLNEGELSRVNWNTQISGINIEPEAAEVLEERWADFLEGRKKGFSLFRHV
jgi:5-methylcytosine-specific restriction protein A